MKKIISFVFLALSLLSCTLFDTPLYEKSASVLSGGFYADSFLIEEKGVYSVEFSSDYNADMICFIDRAGMELFADSGLLYSEKMFFPLVFENSFYEYEDFYTNEDMKYIYYVIDNRDFITIPSGNINFTLKIIK